MKTPLSPLYARITALCAHLDTAPTGVVIHQGQASVTAWTRPTGDGAVEPLAYNASITPGTATSQALAWKKALDTHCAQVTQTLHALTYALHHLPCARALGATAVATFLHTTGKRPSFGYALLPPTMRTLQVTHLTPVTRRTQAWQTRRYQALCDLRLTGPAWIVSAAPPGQTLSDHALPITQRLQAPDAAYAARAHALMTNSYLLNAPTPHTVLRVLADHPIPSLAF